MPPNVPPPDACEGIEANYERLFKETTDAKVKEFCLTALEVRSLACVSVAFNSLQYAPLGTAAESD